jgi:aspartate carbamoyltransferase regulatory subunit
VFSQAATNDSYFFINTKNLKLHVVKSAFRRRGEVIEHINAAMLNMKVFSVLQLSHSEATSAA